MTPLFVANWKMHGSLAFVADWTASAAAASADTNAADIVVCPPHPYLSALKAALPSGFALGAQNCAAEQNPGAHTGEVSAAMLADVGCRFVIVGHSERRSGQQEDNALCAAKIRAAAAATLRPILCIGETATIRERGTDAAIAAVTAQLDAALDTDTAIDALWQHLVIAYEPIWAIGSGVTPSAAEIETIHNALRATLIEKNPAFGGKIPLLYGGSVKSANAKSFINLQQVNGFLVGGASLHPIEFNTICTCHHLT